MLRLAFLLVLTASGCSLVGDAAEVSVAVALPSPPASLTVKAEIDGREVALHPDPTTGGAVLATDPIGASGRTTVACTLRNGSASTRGAITLDLDDGLRYAVGCEVADRDPAELCFGCRGSERFALDSSLGFERDASLYLVWSSTDPDDPVLY